MPHTIAENLQRLQTARTNIATAITTKGGTVTSGDGFEDFVTDIATIPSGGGQAETDLANMISRANNASVTIPNSVTTIGREVFYNWEGLTSVTIPNSVTTIGISAFQGCVNLSSITIPNSVTTISDQAFMSCWGLTSVTVPDTVTSLGASAFANCRRIISATIGNGVPTLGDYAFSSCTNLTSVTIGNGVTTISRYAFRNTALTDIYIDKAEGSVTGAPWGATNATVHWTGT